MQRCRCGHFRTYRIPGSRNGERQPSSLYSTRARACGHTCGTTYQFKICPARASTDASGILSSKHGRTRRAAYSDACPSRRITVHAHSDAYAACATRTSCEACARRMSAQVNAHIEHASHPTPDTELGQHHNAACLHCSARAVHGVYANMV